MVRALYRGGDADTIAAILDSGVIEGSECTVFEGTPDENLGWEPEWQQPVAEIAWEEDALEAEEVAVTGGVTDDITETKRFRGSLGTILVLDPEPLPFERCAYTLKWYDERPGALCHVISHAEAELWTEDGLMALFDWSPRPGGGGRWLVHDDHWGRGNLPATSPQDHFADESEWIAMQGSVDVGAAVEAVVTVTSEKRLGVKYRSNNDDVDEIITDPSVALPAHYERTREALGGVDVPLYSVALEAGPTGPSYAAPASVVYDGDELLDPDEIPARYLGNQ